MARVPLGSAGAAVLAGCALLWLLSAPIHMPLMNLAALLIGLVIVMIGIALNRAGAGRAIADTSLLALAAMVPVTAALGASTEGVARWLVISGITVQPALIAVPALAVAVALRPSALAAAAIAVASVGLALQPDPAAAAMLALGLSGAFARAPRLPAMIAALGFAGAGLAVAVARAIVLPPVPFVEGVLAHAIQSGPATAVAAIAAVVLLFVPAVIGTEAAPPSVRLAFAGVWVAAILASLYGAYPTPVAGYGGSAILGYIVSVGILQLPGKGKVRISRSVREQAQENWSDHRLRLAAAGRNGKVSQVS